MIQQRMRPHTHEAAGRHMHLKHSSANTKSWAHRQQDLDVMCVAERVLPLIYSVTLPRSSRFAANTAVVIPQYPAVLRHILDFLVQNTLILLIIASSAHAQGCMYMHAIQLTES